MEKVKTFLRGRVGSLVLCALEVVIGLLLLLIPNRFLSGVVIGVGVAALLLGVGACVVYFLRKPQDAKERQLLFKGLLLFALGVTCVFTYQSFLTAYTLLTVLFCCVMLVLCAQKLQNMADMLRMKQDMWYLPLISAGIAAALMLILLLTHGSASVWTYGALALILEAVAEIVTIVLL